ncbi:MAG TPA: GNAT family N-acetyltransferase [Conexivisphaerales archaeon]|nr:GNAT family N-acetyltransferase [Conexivisphaerales archaeon]
MPISVVSDPKELQRMAEVWDSFVVAHAANPFFLSGFVKFFMLSCRARGWEPALLVKTSGGDLVGIAAFKTKTTLGVKTAEFLFPVSFSPDFLTTPEESLSFPLESVDYLFRNLGCQLAELVLPGGSHHMATLRKWSDSRVVLFRRLPPKGLLAHSVLPVAGTWEEFSKARGGNFVRHYAKIERKLRQEGEPSYESVTVDRQEVVDRVILVEKKSWKEEYRKGEGGVGDADLEMLLTYSRGSSEVGLQYAPRAWFLKIDGEPIAYALAILFKGRGFIVKTSYDAGYSRYYPGDYVQNLAIRDMFHSGRISLIDFHTWLPYHTRWTTMFQARERVRLCKTGVLAGLLVSFDRTPTSSRISKAAMNRVGMIDIS